MKTTILNIMFLAGLSTMTGLSSCVSDEVKKPADETTTARQGLFHIP